MSNVISCITNRPLTQIFHIASWLGLTSRSFEFSCVVLCNWVNLSGIASPICQKGQSKRPFPILAFSSWFFHLFPKFFLFFLILKYFLLWGALWPTLTPWWLCHINLICMFSILAPIYALRDMCKWSVEWESCVQWAAILLFLSESSGRPIC